MIPQAAVTMRFPSSAAAERCAQIAISISSWAVSASDRYVHRRLRSNRRSIRADEKNPATSTLATTSRRFIGLVAASDHTFAGIST